MNRVINFPTKRPLNLAQAKTLFVEESTILIQGGGIPIVRIAELFGEETAQYASSLTNKNRFYKNGFGVKDFNCDYLTYEGFLQAVTYSNVMKLASQAKDQKEGEN